MRAFVAGATGFTGREVVRILREQSVETYAHVRPDSSRLEEWSDAFGQQGATVDTTAWEQDAMISTMQKLTPDIVFGLLGTTRKRAGADARAGHASGYEAIDYGLTAMLMRASESLENKPRFVYLSAAGVREGSAGGYTHARWKVEQELLVGPLPYTIARPSFIVGERDIDRPGERIGSVLANGGLKLLSFLGGKRLDARYRSTTNTILGGALVRLALDPSAANTIVESEGLRAGP